MSPDDVAMLLRLYLQTLGLSIAFVGTGHFLYRKLFAGRASGSLSLRLAVAYFLGLSAFLPAFVFLSRLVGAEHSLWIALPLMCAISMVETAGVPRGTASVRHASVILAALLLLVVIYSVTNAALWVSRDLPTGGEPGLFTHFGSIHSGRYANYAIFIAQQDTVPYLAQNGGQSMLASVHMLLGANSPLGALMVWIPYSLAFLTLLIYGLFRSGGASAFACLATAFLVMFCNVAVSAVHVLVFDNGSPLAFIGYTDLIVSVATFIIFGRWFQAELPAQAPLGRAPLLVPALLGMTWCWYAPQNIVIAVASCTATVAMGWRQRRYFAIRRRLGEALLAFALAVGIGATQFGTFLPASLREGTGYWTMDVESKFAVRPYIQYLRNHWTAPRWNTEVDLGLYEHTYARAKTTGADEVYRNLEWIAEENLWGSIRIYGFPLLGLVLLGAILRRDPHPRGERSEALRAWLTLSGFAFGFGFLIFFLLELGHMKWWLTRFLVPGTAMALTCLGFAALGGLDAGARLGRKLLWALLFVGATMGPITDLAAEAYRNFGPSARVASIGQRLSTLVRRKDPFLFEGLQFDPRLARREAGGQFTVGGQGNLEGIAVYSAPMPLRPGRYRVGFRMNPAQSPMGESTLAELDVAVDQAREVVARRAIGTKDLEHRANGQWAWLDFELGRETKDACLRLWSRSGVVLSVGDMRLQRLPGATDAHSP